MAETHFLTKRGATWYYHRRVPKLLVPILGSFMKQSLGTGILKEAKVLRNTLNVIVDAKFAAAEKTLSQPGQSEPVQISLAALTEHLRVHIFAIDKLSASRHMSDPPDSPEQLYEMIADTAYAKKALTTPINPDGESMIRAC